MRIVYENTIDDLVAFTRFHAAHSQTIRRQRAIQVWIGTVSLLVGGALFALMTKHFVPLVVGAVLTVLFLLWVPGYFRRYLEREARRIYAEGPNKSMIGWHELELGDGELIERSEFGGTRSALEVVDRIARDAQHTFIYVSSVSAHVIPHATVKEGNVEEFVVALQKQLDDLAPVISRNS